MVEAHLEKDFPVIASLFSTSFRQTVLLRIFGSFKIPMIGYLSPRVIKLNEEICILRIPLARRSRNHLGSMYFGALAVGADCACGLIAFDHIKRSRKPISFVFKNFRADFLRRPQESVDFVCRDGKKIEALVGRAVRSQERVEEIVSVKAFLADQYDEPVADMALTISLKGKS